MLRSSHPDLGTPERLRTTQRLRHTQRGQTDTAHDERIAAQAGRIIRLTDGKVKES